MTKRPKRKRKKFKYVAIKKILVLLSPLLFPTVQPVNIDRELIRYEAKQKVKYQFRCTYGNSNLFYFAVRFC